MKRVFPLLMMFLVIITACSSKKEDDLFNSASEKYKANNFAGAVSDYDQIINEFPKGKHAEESYFAAAAMYQMNKISGLTKEESAKKAIDYFKRYLKQFPDNDKSPKALFLIGFMNANDLQQYDSAKVYYDEFLKKYPESELVESIKMELQNLGKTPDEIIGKAGSAAN